jgi:hypothetical protein
MTAHQCFWDLLARRAELSDAEEASVRAHLRDCPPCQRVAGAFERTAGAPSARAVGVAAIVLNSYVDAKTGALLRQEVGLRDVSALLKAAREGLAVVHPGSAPASPSSTDVARARQTAACGAALHLGAHLQE